MKFYFKNVVPLLTIRSTVSCVAMMGGHGDRKCEFRVLENCEICRGREDL